VLHHGYSFFFFVSGANLVFLDPFNNFPPATNNVRPTQGEAAAAAHLRHGLDVKDDGHLKIFVVIFVFIEVLCIVQRFFSCHDSVRKMNNHVLGSIVRKYSLRSEIV
jgi:hypothetical protein